MCQVQLNMGFWHKEFCFVIWLKANQSKHTDLVWSHVRQRKQVISSVKNRAQAILPATKAVGAGAFVLWGEAERAGIGSVWSRGRFRGIRLQPAGAYSQALHHGVWWQKEIEKINWNKRGSDRAHDLFLSFLTKDTWRHEKVWRHQISFPREVVQSPSSQIFKTKLHKSLSNLAAL